MHKELAKEGLVVITVSLDDISENGEETKARVKDFLSKQGAEFTNLLLNEDQTVWQKNLRFVGPPCYYVFNRQGKWTQFSSDAVDEIDPKAIDRLVLEFLKEK
jgi:hypothetical protein